MAPRAWVRRYGPAEALAGIGALTAFLAVDAATGDRAAASFAAAIGDNLAYYGWLLASEIRRRAALAPGRLRRLYVVPASLRSLACEFGPAEALDTTIVRPACTAAFTAVAGAGAGVLLAKLVADLAFYIPVVGLQELRARAHSRSAREWLRSRRLSGIELD
jgi:hypothetical protein